MTENTWGLSRFNAQGWTAYTKTMSCSIYPAFSEVIVVLVLFHSLNTIILRNSMVHGVLPYRRRTCPQGLLGVFQKRARVHFNNLSWTYRRHVVIQNPTLGTEPHSAIVTYPMRYSQSKYLPVRHKNRSELHQCRTTVLIRSDEL